MAPGGIQGDDAFAPGADQLRPAVEAHHEGVAESIEEQPVLDHLRRHVHQHERVLLGAVGFAGGIQHRHQLAAIVEDRRGAAGEAGVAREEMLIAVDDQRRALEQAGAHAVGAAVLLAPHRAEHQPGAECGIAEAQVAVIIEQHAVVVGQDDRVARAGKLMVQVRHLGVGERDELEVRLLAGQPLFARQHERLALRLRVEMVLAQAADPRALDVVRCRCAVLAGGAPQDRLNVTGMTADRLEHCLPLMSGGAPGCSQHAITPWRRSMPRARHSALDEHRIRYTAPGQWSLLEHCLLMRRRKLPFNCYGRLYV